MNQDEIPQNLLFNISYALDKSHMKFAYIGMQYYGGHFRSAIQLGGDTSPHKYITMDIAAWEEFTKHFSAIMCHLYGYKRDFRKIDMGELEIDLTSAYSSKAVAINQKIKTKEPPSLRAVRYLHEAQDWSTADGLHIDTESTTACIDTTDNADGEPSRKKRKVESLPSVVMLRRTFVILKSMRECIENRLRELEDMSTYVNVMYDVIVEGMKVGVNESVENYVHESMFIKLFNERKNDLITNV